MHFCINQLSNRICADFSVFLWSVSCFLYYLYNDTGRKTCYNEVGSESIRHIVRSDTLEEAEETIEYDSFFMFMEDIILWSIVLF